ncbi:MAG: hypothetical protein Q4B28_02430 [bacterium]|nr:hypothetical protein [bacterium]
MMRSTFYFFEPDDLMYINLHGYSTFSFLESVGKPKDIVKKAKEL